MKCFFNILAVLLLITFSPQAKASENIRLFSDANYQQWVNLERPLQQGELEGRLILLDFWTYCCINCIHALPLINQLHHDYSGRLDIIGVHSGKFSNEKSVVPIRAAIERYGIHHSVFNDADYKIWRHFEVKGWPSMVLLAPDGQIIWRHFGEPQEGQLRAVLDKASEHYQPYFKRKPPLPAKMINKDTQKEKQLRFPSKLELMQNGRVALSNSAANEIIFLDKNGTLIKRVSGFNAPQGLVYDEVKNALYVADTGNHQIKQIDLDSYQVKTLAGTGKRGPIVRQETFLAKDMALASPWDIALWQGGLVIANAGTHQLLSYNLKTAEITVLAGNGTESIDDGVYPENSLSQPSALAVLDDKLYFLDAETSSLRVMDKEGAVVTLIGKGLFDYGHQDGDIADARMQHPLGLSADADNQRLFIADSYNHIIRFYDLRSGQLRSILGNPARYGVDMSSFHEPNDIDHMPDGTLLITDTNNHRILRYDPYQSKLEVFID